MTIKKMYAGLLATRMSSWMVGNSVLHPGQKGFLPYDGVFEQNYLLSTFIERVRDGSSRSDALVSWLDFSDAFGSVAHSAIQLALTAYGAGEVLKDILKDFYTGAKTSFRTRVGLTPEIEFKRGVLQGDPLSGLLFCLVLDPILWMASPLPLERKILAYADDLLPLAGNVEDLQMTIDLVATRAELIGLKLNMP